MNTDLEQLGASFLIPRQAIALAQDARNRAIAQQQVAQARRYAYRETIFRAVQVRERIHADRVFPEGIDG